MPPPVAIQIINKKLAKLFEELSSDDDTPTPTMIPSPADSQKPWLWEFNQYINRVNEVPDGMSLIRWWGVCLVLILER